MKCGPWSSKFWPNLRFLPRRGNSVYQSIKAKSGVKTTSCFTTACQIWPELAKGVSIGRTAPKRFKIWQKSRYFGGFSPPLPNGDIIYRSTWNLAQKTGWAHYHMSNLTLNCQCEWIPEPQIQNLVKLRYFGGFRYAGVTVCRPTDQVEIWHGRLSHSFTVMCQISPRSAKRVWLSCQFCSDSSISSYIHVNSKFVYNCTLFRCTF